MKPSRILMVLTLFLCFTFSLTGQAQPEGKWRTLVLTDIENEPDDAMSMVRFLSYANVWDIEGIIATTSFWQKDKIADWRIYEILDGYRQVQPNLLKHEKGYPSYEEMRSLVKKGLPVYGMNGVGEGNDSEGSDWIISVLEKDDTRPVWIQVWGGVNCLAQALWKIQQTRPPSEAERLYSKVRVYTISDQDDSGPWIRRTFPGIFYICSPGYQHDGADGYHYATWPGISGDAFHGRFHGADKELVSHDWIRENIQEGHGPLGAEYPDVAYLMEGDSPSFMYLIPNGLSEPEHPDYGSWGGRYDYYTPRTRKWFFEPETRPFWSDTQDEYISRVDNLSYTDNKVTIWRWREAYQNDFAARMDWCIMDYKEANHPPMVTLDHPSDLIVTEGETVTLNAASSSDPDGGGLSFEWMQYREPGTYKDQINIDQANAVQAGFTAPDVSRPETLHIILIVTDDGTPALTRYVRIIVSVLPAAD